MHSSVNTCNCFRQPQQTVLYAINKINLIFWGCFWECIPCLTNGTVTKVGALYFHIYAVSKTVFEPMVGVQKMGIT